LEALKAQEFCGEALDSVYFFTVLLQYDPVVLVGISWLLSVLENVIVGLRDTLLLVRCKVAMILRDVKLVIGQILDNNLLVD